MRAFLPTLLLLLPLFVQAQEYESDLFESLNMSSLHLFHSSEKKTMTVTTYRNTADEGNVIETETIYRKGRINPERINFNIKYTEHYAVEDRKKSLGKYEFRDGRLFKYERTDFDNNNARLYTLYYDYYYQKEILTRENIRTKEYVASGSVDFDTIVYRDSVLYEITEANTGYKQNNLMDEGVYTLYEIDADKLMSKTTHFEGFTEKVTYTYDSQGRLVEIMNVLTNDEQGSATTRTELHYSMDGLLDETKFYGEDGKLLERKEFDYK